MFARLRQDRTSETLGATTDTLTYPGTSNRVASIVRGAQTIRTLGYDNAGNITTDARSGTTYGYTYNRRNRLSAVSAGGITQATYVYDGNEQLAIRDSLAAPAGVTHYIHDIFGNVIAETAGGGATGASGTVREYIWLYETEIAPTFGSRTTVDRPLAVVNGVNTASPATWAVHVDHLNRPVKMTDAGKTAVWTAVWTPWGAAHAITGSATLNARFPGQWFQVEAGLHYNWHRHYDPSLGRYTQPDPLGFVDGPSVYGYANASPAIHLDFDGQFVINPITVTLARAALTRAAKKLMRPKPKPRKRERQPKPTPPLPEPPEPNTECQGEQDEECDPPAGTRCYDGPDYGRPHFGMSPHYQLYVMQRRRSDGECQWRPIKKKGGVVKEPPSGMSDCSTYSNWRRKGGGR